MKDPVRLIDAEGTEFERLLLSAAAREVPSAEVSARMLAGAASAGAAVALLSSMEAAGEGALTSSGALQVAGASVLGSAGGSIAPPATASLLGTWLVKWGAIGALFSGAVVSGWLVVSQAQPAVVAPKQVLAPVSKPLGATDAQHAEVTQPAASDSSDLEPGPEGGQASPAVATRGTQTRAAAHGSSTAGSTLGQEVALLDSARQALTAGDAERALSLISSYRRKFPGGALEQEATVLEVDALEAKGRAAQATDLKQQFLLEHPESAHTNRVKRSGQPR